MHFNLKDWKKVQDHATHSVFTNSEGHELKIAKNPLSKGVRQKLEAIPMAKMAEGGQVSDDEIIEKKSKVDKANKENMEYGASQQEYPADVQKRMKETDVTPKMMADGGEVADSEMPDEAPIPMPEAPAPMPSAQMAPMDPQAPGMPINTSPEQDSPMPVSMATGAPMAAQSPPPAMPPAQAAPQQPGGLNTAPDYMAGYRNQVQAQQMSADAVNQQAKAIEKSQAAHLEAQNDMMTVYNDHVKHLDEERMALQEDIKNSHIDPNHYLGSQDTGARVTTAIGLILGGLGAGLTGGPNTASQFLNQQIDRDIEAQKANLGKKETLLSANMREYGNLRDATQMTRLMMNDTVATELQMAAAKAQGQQAKANALNAIGELQKQAGPMQQQLAIRRSLASLNDSGSNALAGQDPAKFVPSVVPPEHQKGVFGEIERAQDTRRMSGAIMKAFDQAEKENTVLKTGAGLLRTPASVYSLHQAMQPTFKDLEGTVRQAAMDNTFKNITPQPGDAQHTIDTKRQALSDYLQSKASAPIAKSFGLDLDKFSSTTTSPIPKNEIKSINGVQYQKTQGGWQKIK